MTGRRARRAHRPTAAFWWGTAKVLALIGASTALGVSLALVAGEAIYHGRWLVTPEAASVAFLALILCALAAVAHALMVHAIDGPPADPWACSECGAAPGKCPTYCSQWEAVSDYDEDVLGLSGLYDADGDADDIDEADAIAEQAEDARWYGGAQ